MTGRSKVHHPDVKRPGQIAKGALPCYIASVLFQPLKSLIVDAEIPLMQRLRLAAP